MSYNNYYCFGTKLGFATIRGNNKQELNAEVEKIWMIMKLVSGVRVIGDPG